MTITAWTVKARTGRIYPSWIFETEEEASDFCSELNERCRPQTHYVFKVSISVDPTQT